MPNDYAKEPGSNASQSSSPVLPLLTAALAALGLASGAHAQIQVGGALLVNVDATAATPGTLTSITNGGTLGGYFEARGGGTTVPLVSPVHGNGTRGIRFDGGQYMQLVPSLGSAPTPPPVGIIGANPTFTIEAWVMNPVIQEEETVVSWGKRGGPDGSNCSFNYGWDSAYGAMGHWGSPDLGWDSSSASAGVYAPGVPPAGAWHHLVYTFDGAVQRAYSDGIQKNSESVTLSIAGGTSINLAAQLEADGTNVTAGLRGSMTIARLRIHDEALTPAQVANNYNFEASGFTNGGAPLTLGPAHRYSFNNSVGTAVEGAVIPDVAGGAAGNAVVHGTGATFTGSRIMLPGGSSATAAYVDLPNGLLSGNSTNLGGIGEITIEGWVKVTGAHTWSRIFDFGSSDIGGGVGGEVTGAGGGGAGMDYLFWSAQNGDNLNVQTVAWRNVDPTDPGAPLNGGGVDHDTATAASFPKDFHFALTWNERTGQIFIYENGSQFQSMSMPIAMSDIHDVNVWLGRSNWSGDQNAQEEFDEFRIYNRVLPPEQIEASYKGGPAITVTANSVSIATPPENQVTGERGSAVFNVAAQGALPITFQWYKGSLPIPNATNSFVTFTNIPITDNGAHISVIASNNIAGSPFTATSSVATLTVLPDTNAPTLTAARFDALTVVEVFFSEDVRAADLTAVNFSFSGPAGSPTVASVAPGSTANRALLTLSGPVGCAYYTVTVNNVHDASSTGNPIAANSTIQLWNLTSSGLTHRYTFNNQPTADASGAIVPDIIAGADGVVRNNTGQASFTGGRLVLGGGPSASAPYVDLPNGLLSINSTNNGGTGKVTFEGWVKVTGNHSWSRIFDFGSSGACCAPGGEVLGPGGGDQGIDYLFYSAEVGVNTGRRRIDVTNRDQADHGTIGDEWNTGTFNQDVHFVVSWDEATGSIVVYENGSQVSIMTTAAAMSEINDVNVWLGRSNWAGDENLQGEFDDFRVYNRVLRANEIQLDKAGGPDGAFGAPLSLDLVVTNHSIVTNSVRALPVLVNFSLVGTQNVAGAGCVTYTSSVPSVAEITADGLLHAYSAGTAVVTAIFGNLQESETVFVVGDNTPPVITGAIGEGNRYIRVSFSEPVDELTGAEPLSYTVTGPSGAVEVAAAQRETDPSKVLLTLSAPMACEYITVRAAGVADFVGNAAGDSGSASFMNYSPQSLKHRYTFNNASNANATDFVVLDGVGAGDGRIKGSPVSLNGSRVILNGGSSASAGYVDLPNGLLSTNSTNNAGSGQLTFEGWMKVTGNRQWSRIFDFGSSGSCCAPGGEITGPGGSGEGIDYLMLSAEVDTDTGHRRVELQNRDTNHGFVNNDYATTTFNQDVHFVLTWDERTGNIRVFENGAQVSSINTVAAMSEINDVNVWLGRSTWTGDQNLQGEFDEFRVYNRVLTTNEIVLDRSVGPDNNFGAPRAVSISGPTLLHVGQPATSAVLADFANVSNVNLTLGGCAIATSTAMGIVSNDASGNLYPLAAGTATLRVVFSGITNTLAVVVTNDLAIARDDGLTTTMNVPTSISTARLLANDIGVGIGVSSVSANSTNGGTVTRSGDQVTYTPVTGYSGPDLFTYSITNSAGATGNGNVFVYVVNGTMPNQNAVTIKRNAGSYTVTFRGTPGTTYAIQRATAITGPWTTISTQTVPPSGIIAVTDSSPPPDQAFYKVIVP